MFVLAPGVLSGTSAPTSGRLSVGGKSPLTGGIKEANVGGNPGQDLMKLGYRAIVVTGKPEDSDRLFALEVEENEARVVAADDHKGKWNYALIEDLVTVYPKTASFVSIGPAGEMGLHGASVACTDSAKERRPALDALVKDATRRKVDVLVCWRLDRLGRNLKHLVTLVCRIKWQGR